MGWFRRWRMRRAAKQYARRLGPYLQHAYGASDCYSPAQIRTSVRKLGLNPGFIALGYAGFVPGDQYALAANDAPVWIPYAEAHGVFEQFRPPVLFSASGNPETSIKIVGVGYSDH